MLSQMVRLHFIWISNSHYIYIYIYVCLHLFYLFVCWWACRLLEYIGYCDYVTNNIGMHQFSSVASHVRLFATSWTAPHQTSLSITNSWSLPKLISIESLMPSNHLILCRPFSSRLQSSPASGSFQMSQFFASGGQSLGVSASTSVLPMNIQDWFPLGWTDWISLQSKGLLRVFSNTTVQKHQFFSTQLSL